MRKLFRVFYLYSIYKMTTITETSISMSSASTITRTVRCPLKQNEITDICRLEKPDSSLFIGVDCREYPTFEMLYGFLHNKMGVKLRKHVAKTYADEHTHYKNYIKETRRIGRYRHVEVSYTLSSSGWGRINAVRSLSMSLFHRPTRHSFAKEKYLDFDMVNCQVQAIFCLAKKLKLDTTGLAEYCADSKKMRLEIAEYYGLKDIKFPDGTCMTAKEQAKKLPLRLAFGGGMTEWKTEFGVKKNTDMPMIKKMRSCIQAISDYVYSSNPHILADLEASVERFGDKTDYQKRSSVLAYYAQTWERIIQEECIALLCRNNKGIQLRDIVPSQDGFMVLKEQMKDINIPELFNTFNTMIMAKFGLDMSWTMKEFDEAIQIPLIERPPLYINYNDLLLGEKRITDLITDVLYDDMKYYEVGDEKWWYIYNSNTGLWSKQKKANEYRIVETIQDSIQDEIKDVTSLVCKNLQDDANRKIDKNTDDDGKKKKKVNKMMDELEKLKEYVAKVGKPAYSSQVAKFLCETLKDNQFVKLLDQTVGKLVFADGILDLKVGLVGGFSEGFKRENYITSTLSHKYRGLKTTPEKMNKLKKVIKEITNNSDEHFEYYMGVIGHAMTGDASREKSIYYIVDGTDNKKGDNGKTFVFELIANAFPELVRTTDPKVLEDGYAKAHKQIATWKGVRVIYADEGTKKKLNAGLVKKIGDGITIENEIMFGCVEIIDVMFKMFICSNHIPKIDQDEEAVYNRYKQLQMCSHFDRKGIRKVANPDKLEFIADTKLPELLKTEYVHEMIQLVIEYAVKYYESGIPAVPDAFERAAKQTKTNNNAFAKWFDENFESGSDKNKISADFITAEYGQLDKKEVIKEMEKIGYDYNREMKGLGDKIGVDGKKVYIKGGFSCIKKRVIEEDDEIVEE